MEPGDRAAQALSSPTLGLNPLRLLAGCALLTGLAFVQDPGFLAADTKFDLVQAPLDFLARALHLWDAQGAMGQLQNQAYGYLWPMGPFFVLGDALSLPGWVVQRLWWALLLCVAFTGVALAARALGLRSELACLTAGVAYALSPRILTTIGPISIEAWPSALAPWVLLPLILGSTRGSAHRAAALSALAVAMVGGVNAAATFAVLPVGAVWLLTLTPGARRRQLMLWWPVFTLLGTLWWLIPLFLLGAYSPPFLDFIETTQVTTFPTTLFDTLRGTSNWVPYVTAQSRAGNDLLVDGYPALASGLILLVGFAGLLSRHNQHRAFLGLSLLVGVVMVTAGHRGAVEGWAAADIRGLLDGALSPLRNVHKFDPVVRLPLVLGLAFVVDRWRTLRRSDQAAYAERSIAGAQSSSTDRTEWLLSRVNHAAVLGMVGVALLASVTPALLGRLVPAHPVLAVPDYWQETAAWLDERAPDSSTLLVPGSGFASYVWGDPRDEPMQYLSDSPWAVRNQIPLTPPGNIRMLGEIEDQFAQGRGSAGLADYLRRAGVRYLVVRNDLRRNNDVPDPVLVHQTIERTPGLRRVQAFGPEVGGGPVLSAGGARVLINDGWQSRFPAVEIFELAGAEPLATATDQPPIVVGGPEDLLDLADLDVISSGSTILAADAASAGEVAADTTEGFILTDGLRRRETFFPRLHDNQSATLTPEDARRNSTPARDFLEPRQDRWTTRARSEGGVVVASSSRADANAPGGSRRGQLAHAAMDGSSKTQWVVNPAQEGPRWWRLDLEGPGEIARVRLTGGADAAERQTVRILTNSTRSPVLDLGPGEVAEVAVDSAEARWLRVEQASGSLGSPMALAEVEVLDPKGRSLEVVRRLVLPELPSAWGDPDTIVLRPDLDARRGCVEVDDELRCSSRQVRASEEATYAARRFTLTQARTYPARLLVRPRAGAALDALVQAGLAVGASASTTAVTDPRASALAAVDGDPATTWTADPADLRPVLDLRWLGVSDVTGLSLSRSPNVAARLPQELVLVWPGGRRRVEVDVLGRVRFPPIRTDRLELRVIEAEAARSLDFDAQGSSVGVGITELRVLGVPAFPATLSDDVVSRPCGSGPTVKVNGRRFATSISASARELMGGGELPARICPPLNRLPETRSPGGFPLRELDLVAGVNDITLFHADAFEATALVLGEDRPGEPSIGVALRRDAPSDLVLSATQDPIAPGGGVLALHQNANPGWEATDGGSRLPPVILDGWQQGWMTDRAASEDPKVAVRFAPDRTYRAGLLAGLLSLLGLVALAGWPRWRSGRDLPPLRPRLLDARLGLGLALAGGGLLAGWWGALVATAAIALVVAVRTRLGEAGPWLWSLPSVVVGAAYFLRPWANPEGWAGSWAWPIYLMLVPLAAALGCAMSRRPLPKPFKRMAGASTRR